MPPTPSPQKRRQTFAPQDFTFRAGSQEIVFGNPTELSSPGKNGAASGGGRRRTTAAPTAAAATAASSSLSEAGVGETRRRATIRAVSAEPAGQVGARRTEPSRRLVHDANAGVDGQADQAKGVPGSRKRKFDFENAAHPDPSPQHEVLPYGGPEGEESGEAGSGKENRSLPFSRSPGAKVGGNGMKGGAAIHERATLGEEEEEEEEDPRPAKRTKTSSSATAETKGSGRGRQGVSNARPMPSTAGSATVAGTGGKRRTTLGVRPRGEKKSATLAMAGRRGGPAAAAGQGGVRRAPASGAGGVGGDAVSGPGAATAGAAGGTAGNAPGKSTISRERLNALAAPKRRA
ncbi:hypothetical protein KC336_g21214 [Hortaea werneckii]|nr:hypothetical protein KC336_g21214 [Hortaea werneckii]